MRVFEFILLLCLSNCLICSTDGYADYLSRYSYKGGDHEEDYIEEHKESFIANCRNLNHRIRLGYYAGETGLLDWSNKELEGLGELSMKYSGTATLYDEIDVLKREFHVKKSVRDFPELSEYNDPKKNCGTSWVTSAIEVAEASLENRIRLSSRQLFECLPKEERMDGCRGVNPRILSEYLSVIGLVSEKDFKDCESVDEKKRYHFNTVYPESPNAGGLMNLVGENRLVFVMVAVDLLKLRFVKDMSEVEECLKCADYQPSLYGVVSGYKIDEMMENSYWKMSSHVIPGEEVVLKIPMSGNMENANYAGIAAYAFGLERVGELPGSEGTEVPVITEEPTQVYCETETPTPVIPTEIPTTTVPTLPACGDDLVVSSDIDCSKLLETGWKMITINEGLCNSMTSDWVISDYPCLREILVKKNSLRNLNSLIVSNNQQLEKIVTEDGTDYSDAPFVEVKSAVIENLPQLTTFKTGDLSFMSTTSLIMENLPQLTTFKTGGYSFWSTTNLTLSSLLIVD